MKYTIPQGATEVEILDPIFTVPPPPTNQPPTANAGSDVTVTLPQNTVTLKGRGLDPEGLAVSFLWEQTSGNKATILSPTAANTDVILPGVGLFSFRLTVNDGVNTTSDDVNVTVNDAPIPPPTTKYFGWGSQATGGSTVVSIRTKSDFDNFYNNPNGKIAKFINNLSFNGRYDFTNKSYFTIDANGFDISIDNNNNGDGISIGSGCHHIIVIGMRITNSGNDGANCVDGSNNILFDHCSMYGNRDGNLDCAGDNSGRTSYITFQFCILGYGSAGWSGDTLVTGDKTTIHHCLYNPVDPTGKVTLAERCPYIHCNYSPVGSPNCDFRNNVVADWNRYATGIGYKATANIVGNYYAKNKTGAIDPNADPSGNTSSNHGWYFVSGNGQLGGKDINLGGGNHAEYVIPDPYKVPTEDYRTAAQRVKNEVGTAVKNSYEQKLIDSVTIQ